MKKNWFWYTVWLITTAVTNLLHKLSVFAAWRMLRKTN